MRWLEVKNEEELKKLAKVYNKSPFNNMRLEIKRDLKILVELHGYKEKTALDMFNITSGTWSGLFDKIVIFRDIMGSISLEKKISKAENSEISYFKSEEDELIFYLLEMEGKKRSDKLGITRKCFMDKAFAKKWRSKLAIKIHPDKSKNKNAAKASAVLNQLYSEMAGDE